MLRAVGVVCVAVLALAACSDSDDAAGVATSTTVDDSQAAVTTTSEPVAPRPTAAPTSAPEPVPPLSDTTGTDVEEIFVEPLAKAIGYVELDDDTRASLEARFRQDDRIDEFLTGVAARGVQRDDDLSGVVVAVGVSPSVATDGEFQEAFEQAATDGADLADEPLRLGDEILVSYRGANGLHSLLWKHENVFVLISGRDSDQVADVASVLVTTLVGPYGLADDLDEDGLAESDLDGDGTPDLDMDGDGVPDGQTAPPAAPVPPTTSA